MNNANEEIIASVFMITYNHEKYIGKALDSILMQKTNFRYEIVIGEDCSTDNTRKILLDYQKRYPDKFKSLLHNENIGMMPNVVATLKVCTGKYIAMIEGDDYWTDPEKLQLQIDSMRQNPECHLSFHPASEEINGDLSGKVWGDHGSSKIFTDMEMIRSIGNVFCPTASMVFDRKAIDPFPPFMENAPIGDIFLQILSSLNGGALYIARNMSVYRKGTPGSWTKRQREVANDTTNAFIKNTETHILKYIKSLDEMGSYIDQKYRMEIDKKISGQYFKLSLFYLNHKMDDNFKKAIIHSYQAAPEKIDFFMRLAYCLKFSPKLIRTLMGVKNAKNIVYNQIKKMKKHWKRI